MYNDYGYIESGFYWSMGHQLRHDLNHFRRDNNDVVNHQTDVINAVVTAQTHQQKEDAHEMRKNQTTLVGQIILTLKGLFSKDKDASIGGESFYEMVQRENNETQRYLEEQANAQKSSAEKLTNVIESLNDIADDIVRDTEGDAENAQAIKDAIDDLKSKSVDIANAIKNFKPVNVNSVNI